MRILGLMSNTVTGCEQYRIIQPLEQMREMGVTTGWMTADRAWAEIRSGRPNPFLHTDVVIVNRLVIPKGEGEEAITALFDNMRSLNPALRIVCDYDDDLTPQSNVKRKIYPDTHVLADPRLYDRLIVSTSPLRDLMSKYNPKVTVRPNYVRMPDFMNRMRFTQSDKITIGLTGSSTHKEDWKAVITPLRRIQYEFSDRVQVFVSGFEVPELDDYLTPRDLGICDDIVVPFDLYPAVFAQMDFVLIPLDPDDKFNSRKSNIKALEAAASARMIDPQHVGGCPSIVVSDPPVYLDYARNGENCLLVRHHHGEDWYEAMRRLIVDTNLRNKLSIGAFKTVVPWDLSAHTRELVTLFQNVSKASRMSASTRRR